MTVQYLRFKTDNPDFRPFASEKITAYEMRKKRYGLNDYEIKYAFSQWRDMLLQADPDIRSLQYRREYYQDKLKHAYDHAAGIDAFERWQDERALKLDMVRAKMPVWLEDYAHQMINDYERVNSPVPVSTLQENLLTALKFAVKFTGNIPDQHTVKISSNGNGRIDITACSNGAWVTSFIGAMPGNKFAANVPGKLMLDLMNALPPERVDLSVENAALHIKCANAQANVKRYETVSNVTDMPALSNAESMLISDTKRLISELERLVMVTATPKLNRPLLECVLIRLTENGITLAASDSTQLASGEIQVEGSSHTGDYPLHKTTIRALIALLKSTGGTVQISAQDDILFVSGDSYTAAFRREADHFVDFEAIQRYSIKATISVDLHEMVTTLKTLRALQKNSFKQLVNNTLYLDTRCNLSDHDDLTLTAKHIENGDTTRTLPAKVQLLQDTPPITNAMLDIEKLAKILATFDKATKKQVEPVLTMGVDNYGVWHLSAGDKSATLMGMIPRQ